MRLILLEWQTIAPSWIMLAYIGLGIGKGIGIGIGTGTVIVTGILVLFCYITSERQSFWNKPTYEKHISHKFEA